MLLALLCGNWRFYVGTGASMWEKSKDAHGVGDGIHQVPERIESSQKYHFHSTGLGTEKSYDLLMTISFAALSLYCPCRVALETGNLARRQKGGGGSGGGVWSQTLQKWAAGMSHVTHTWTKLSFLGPEPPHPHRRLGEAPRGNSLAIRPFFLQKGFSLN